MSTLIHLTPVDRAVVRDWLAARADELRASAQASDRSAAYADRSQARAADQRDARDYRARAAALDVERTLLEVAR